MKIFTKTILLSSILFFTSYCFSQNPTIIWENQPYKTQPSSLVNINIQKQKKNCKDDQAFCINIKNLSNNAVVVQCTIYAILTCGNEVSVNVDVNIDPKKSLNGNNYYEENNPLIGFATINDCEGEKELNDINRISFVGIRNIVVQEIENTAVGNDDITQQMLDLQKKLEALQQKLKEKEEPTYTKPNKTNVPSPDMNLTSSLDDKRWYLIKLQHSENLNFLIENNAIWIEFNTFNNKCNGFGACNKFEAVIQTNSISTFNIDKLTPNTGNICKDKKVEDLFFEILKEADRYEIKNKILKLYQGDIFLMDFSSSPVNTQNYNSTKSTATYTNDSKDKKENSLNKTTNSTIYEDSKPLIDEKDKEIEELRRQLAEKKQLEEQIAIKKKQEPDAIEAAKLAEIEKQKEIEELKRQLAEKKQLEEQKRLQAEQEASAAKKKQEEAAAEAARLAEIEKQKEIEELKRQLAEKKQLEEQKRLQAEQEALAAKKKQEEAAAEAARLAEIEKQKAAKQKEIDELKRQLAEKEKEVTSITTNKSPNIPQKTTDNEQQKTNSNIGSTNTKLSKSEAKEIQKHESEKKIEELNKNLSTTTSPKTEIKKTSDDDEQITIGIFPFKGPYKNYVYDLQAQTTQAFSKKTRFTVVDRTNIEIIKAEKEMQKSEDFIDGLVVDQGKSIGAKYVVTGTLQTIGANAQQFKRTDYNTKQYWYETKYAGYLSFSLNLIETETGKIKSTQNFNLKTNSTGWSSLFTASAGFYDNEATAINTVMSAANGFILAWINNVFPVSMKIIRINEFDKKGKPSEILIKGGSDTDLKKGSDLFVIYPEIIIVDGKEYIKPTDIGQIKVLDVDGEFSTCKIKEGGERIQELISQGKQLTLSIKSYK